MNTPKPPTICGDTVIRRIRGVIDTFNQVYPQLYDIDLRKKYTKLKIPIYFFLGRHDANAPVALTQQYYDCLETSSKSIVWFEHSGHSPWLKATPHKVERLKKW